MVIKSNIKFDEKKLDEFILDIQKIRKKTNWNKEEILKLYYKVLPNFQYKDSGKYLDDKM